MDEHTSHELAYKKGYEQGKQDAMKWIPVTERLPMYNVDVLVYRPAMAMKVLVSSYEGYYGEDDNEWHEGWVMYGKGLAGNSVITHWMPLPEAPTTCHMTSKQQPPKGE